MADSPDSDLVLGNPNRPPTPQRDPDPLVDGLATDGVQPADRGHVDIDPMGGR
jgi:hypothetical protein